MFFATFMLLSAPYVCFLVPETKGIPLEDINSLFRKGLKPWRAHGVVLEEIRARHAHDSEINHPSYDIKRSASHDDSV